MCLAQGHKAVTPVRLVNSAFQTEKEEISEEYSKTCVKRPLSKRQQISFQDQLSLNAGKMYCRMHQGEHSAILSTCIKLPCH